MRPTELALSSRIFDQPPTTSLPRCKLLILSLHRTGSYMLCRLLLNAGLGIPHEYFNEIHVRLIGRRSGIAGLGDARAMMSDEALLLRYLAYILAHRTRDGLFAAKIHYQHYYCYLRGQVGTEVFRDAQVIYLTREDKVAQAVSRHISECSGRWGFEQTSLTPPRPDLDPRDMAGIERMMRRAAIEEAVWERVFEVRGVTPLRMTYEQLCRDPADAVASAATLCGVDPATLQQGYDDGGRYAEDPAYPGKAELATLFRQHLQDRAAAAAPAA